MTLGSVTANAEVFFNSMDENAIYIGTADHERWTKAEFLSFAKPYFDKGKAWDFKAYGRNIHVTSDGQYAWFSELLTTWMCVCRGSGIIHKNAKGWKIDQYHLSVTVPNEIIEDFIALVDHFQKSAQKNNLVGKIGLQSFPHFIKLSYQCRILPLFRQKRNPSLSTFEGLFNPSTMASMRNYDFRVISNARIASRFKQFIILVMAVLIGMIISVSVNAQNRFQKNNARFYKSKFKTQINQYANACNLLEKKRTHKPKTNIRLAALSKTKNKSTAEIDHFGKVLSYSKSTAKSTVKPVATTTETTTPSPEKLEALRKAEGVLVAGSN